MNDIFRRTGALIESRCTIIIILSVLLIIPLGLAATSLEMKTGNDTFVSSDSEVYQDYEKFTDRFSDDVIMVILAGEDLSGLLQPENLAVMETVETEMAAQPHVISAIGPAFSIKQTISSEGKISELPQDTHEVLNIVTDSETGEIRPEFTHILPDTQHAFIAITIDATISTDEKSDLIELIRQTTAAAAFTDDTDIIITGFSVFREEIMDTMAESMTKMVILAVILMLVILALIFSVRGFFAWRWLPLGVVFLGIIYAFGCMGLFDIPITATTMAVFPVLIGLGVDYAIQFHNRYDEQSRSGHGSAIAAIDSVTHIGPAIGIAIIAACLGFAALLFSPVPMIRDFALTLIIGVTECYLLSMFFLVAILYRHDRRKTAIPKTSLKKQAPRSAEQHSGAVEKGLSRLAPWVINNPILIIGIAVLITVAGLIVDSQIDTETDQTKLLSPNSPAGRDFNTLQKLGGGLMSTNLLIESVDVTDPGVLDWILKIEERVKDEKPNIVTATDSVADLVMRANNGRIPQSSAEIRSILEDIPIPVKRNLITDDFTAANVIISVTERDTDLYEELAIYLKDEVADHPETINVTVTGMTQIAGKLFDSLTSGREKMTLLGIIFVFLGLLLLFRFKVLRALMAIIPVALIIGWSSVVMYMTDIEYTPLTATLGALIIGIGVEFTILLMMRYYEERARGENAREAMTTSIVKIGRAICASGFTVIGGFGALLIAEDFPVLRDFGIVTMINVFFALVATLVVLPPMIVRLDTWRERRSSG